MTFKPGMMPWHNKNCDMEFKNEVKDTRAHWCKTHNQWAHESAIETVYVFREEG